MSFISNLPMPSPQLIAAGSTAPNTKRRIALLHGGGLDSTAVFLWLVHHRIEFVSLSIDYGHIAYQAEKTAITRQCLKYNQAIQLYSDDRIKHNNSGECFLFTGNPDHSPVVENRNEQLCDIASMLGYSHIILGLDKPVTGKAWDDASVEFVERMNQRYLKNSFAPSTVYAPFIEIDKKDVYDAACELDPNFFGLSMTCWAPIDNKPCGTCKHCSIESRYKEACLLGSNY